MTNSVWALAPDEITEHLCSTQSRMHIGWLSAVMYTPKHNDLVRMVMTSWAISKQVFAPLFR